MYTYKCMYIYTLTHNKKQLTRNTQTRPFSDLTQWNCCIFFFFVKLVMLTFLQPFCCFMLRRNVLRWVSYLRILAKIMLLHSKNKCTVESWFFWTILSVLLLTNLYCKNVSQWTCFCHSLSVKPTFFIFFANSLWIDFSHALI